MAHLRYWRRDIDESDDLYGETLRSKYFNISIESFEMTFLFIDLLQQNEDLQYKR